jgi:hypothetical protein
MPKDQKQLSRGKMDNPENSLTDKEHILDKFEEEQNVDSIPIEDLRQENKEERHPRDTKQSSSSEKKLKPEQQEKIA